MSRWWLPPPPSPTKGLIGLISLPFFFLALEISKPLNIFNQRHCNSVKDTENTSESFPVWFYLIFDGNLNQTSNFFEHKCDFWTFFGVFLEFHPVKICSVAPMIARTSKTIKIHSFYLYFLPLSIWCQCKAMTRFSFLI